MSTRGSATGNDYADQRYYSSALGRFMTDDPSGDAWNPSNPQSWNTYAYVLGDPINSTDPSGLVECGDLSVTGGGTVRSYVDANTQAGLLTRFVWAEGGTLAQNSGSQDLLTAADLVIAQAVENDLAIANGQVAVLGADGNIYWGNGGTFNGVPTMRASILGYGGLGTTLGQEIARLAAGTNPPEVNAFGQLTSTFQKSLDSSLNQELGDPTRALPGRVPVTLSDGSVDYVTPECDRAILAYQSTNTILAGVTINSQTSKGVFFPTNWKAAGGSSPAPNVLFPLGPIGGTTFFGYGGFQYAQYPYSPVRAPHGGGHR